MKKSLLAASAFLMCFFISAQTPTLIKDINPGNNNGFMGGMMGVNYNGYFYFAADDGVNGIELWRTDGTGGGTTLFADLHAGSVGSGVISMTVYNNELYFFADSSNTSSGPQLWKTDGVSTTMIYDPSGNGFASSLVVCNNKLLFTYNDMGTYGSEIFVSDGTTSGTAMLTDLNPGGASGAMFDAYMRTYVVVGNNLYFAGNEGTNGDELWKTDGTLSGTAMVKDIMSGSSGSMLKNFVRNGSVFYFGASNSTSGSELWKSDGTTSGTSLVKDIDPGISSSGAEPIDTLGGLLFFKASSSSLGSEPYISDGTSSGTVLLADVNPGSQSSFNMPMGVEHVVTSNGIYFTAETPATGAELYKTDGATVWLHNDINSSGSSSPANFLLVNNYIFFSADNGTTGSELMRSYVNGSGVQNLSDLNPGTGGAQIGDLFIYNGCLLFSANDGTNGTEPYIFCTNLPPALSTAQTVINVCTNSGTLQIPVTITDEDTNSVVLSASSSNTTLIQNTGLNFSGTGGTRVLSVTVQANQSGTSVVTISGTDNDSNSVNHMVTINVLPAPTQELCLVSVDSATSNFNQIVWEKPVATDIDSFIIYREVTTNVYQRIGAVPYDSLAEFPDTAANPNVTSYKYKIAVKDTCGNESTQSLYHNTIHLQYLGNGNLQWTLYAIESSANPVTFYRVWRDDFSLGNWNPISSTVPGGNSTYTDINYALYPSASYRVDVTWGFSCDPSRAIINTSRSNIKNIAPTTGIQESFANSKATVFVNENNVAVFSFSAPASSATRVELFDATGRLVESRMFTGNQAEIGLNALANGIYCYRIYGSVNAKGKIAHGK